MTAGDPRAAVKVWDPLVRVLHWTLVASIAAAWVTSEGGGRWHEWIGYVALAVVPIRLLWGLVGTKHARFVDFVRSVGATRDYAKRLMAHREPRYVGHNPLGGWMVVALLVSVAAVAGTGWLYTTDAFWGVEWVEDLHEFLAEAMLLLVALHVGGVLFTSLRHGENLVRAMITGRKRAAEAGDVD